MKLKILNNTMSPSVLLMGKENILINCPKGIYTNKKIDKILFTSDDKYHTYDLEKFKNEDYIITIYGYRKHKDNIKRSVKDFNYYFDYEEIEPYKELFGIIPILLKRKPFSVNSEEVLGFKINKSLLITSFGNFTKQSIKYLKDIDNLLITIKYLNKNNRKDYISLKQTLDYMKENKIKNMGIIGINRKLRKDFKNKVLNVGEVFEL